MQVCPQAVSVVTTKAKDRLYGITVSSFTSVSLEPPLILVSIAKASRNHNVFTNAKELAVNLLADDQRSVSDRFAGRTQADERFDGLKIHYDKTSSPIIGGSCAYIECRNWKAYNGGDHSLVLGEVVHARRVTDKSPLIYYTRQYTTIISPESAPSPVEILW